MKKFNIGVATISVIAVALMLLHTHYANRVKPQELYEYTAVEEYKININKADKTTLTILNGLGEVTADSIVSYRNDNGEFKSINELDNVYGIGERKISAWREFITIED